MPQRLGSFRKLTPQFMLQTSSSGIILILLIAKSFTCYIGPVGTVCGILFLGCSLDVEVKSMSKSVMSLEHMHPTAGEVH